MRNQSLMLPNKASSGLPKSLDPSSAEVISGAVQQQM